MKLTEVAVLAMIQEHLKCRDQWLAMHCLDSACEYERKAEGLIELIEVVNCGSVGGHDEGQPQANNVDDRFAWLRRKYSHLEIKNGRVIAKPIKQARRRTGLSKCDECKKQVKEIIGCPDGAEICQACFDAGKH